MNCYNVKTKNKATLRVSDFYVSAPDYRTVELVAKKEKYGELILSITCVGECFNFSSLYTQEACGKD